MSAVDQQFQFQGRPKICTFRHWTLQKGLLHFNTIIYSLISEFCTSGWYCLACYARELPSRCFLNCLRVPAWGLIAACLGEAKMSPLVLPSPAWGVLQWSFPYWKENGWGPHGNIPTSALFRCYHTLGWKNSLLRQWRSSPLQCSWGQMPSEVLCSFSWLEGEQGIPACIHCMWLNNDRNSW